MRNTIAITLYAMSLGLTSIGYAQGTTGRSGSGAASGEKQAESTSPSALSGSAGTKQQDNTKAALQRGDTPVERATPTNPVDESGTASNRSSSGSSTNTSPAQVPSKTGKTSESVKSSPPLPDTSTHRSGAAPK